MLKTDNKIKLLALLKIDSHYDVIVPTHNYIILFKNINK